VAVSKPEDFYIVQSSRPQQIMLSLTEKNVKYLLADNKPPLPFKPAEIILTLDPFFPQDIAGIENGKMAGEITELIERGYSQYMVNNPGHFSLFRGQEKIKLIAGPWLYTFNTWALSFVSAFGVDGFVSPLENNRQNLERTLGVKSRKSGDRDGKPHGKKKQAGKYSALHSKYFITVFAYPPLFNIRANLRPVLDFNLFADNRNETFSLVTGSGAVYGSGGSHVYPTEAFSIIDKIPFLKEAGFARFIIDLTGPVLKKSNYKDLMHAVKEGDPLPQTNRFNWKDGFFSA
jgi:putative protease